MTIKQEIDWLVHELNCVGSHMTLNGNNNHIKYIYNREGRFYNVFMNNRIIGVSMTAKECLAALHILCCVL